MLLFSGISILTSSAQEGMSLDKKSLNIKPLDTLYINMFNNDNLIDSDYIKRRNSQELVLDNGVEKLFSSRINLDIKKSKNNQAYIKIRKKTKGKSIKKATENAAAIEYHFEQNKQYLNLDSYFLTVNKNKRQKKSIDIILYLPEETTVFLDQSTKTFLDDVKNAQDILDRNMPNHYFKMTKKGFVCLDCNINTYRNDDFNAKNFKLNIDKNGVDINIGNKDKTTIKINSEGLKINE